MSPMIRDTRGGSTRLRHPTLPDWHMQRAIEQMVTGARRDLLKRRSARAYDTNSERDEQIQMSVSGSVGGIAAYALVPLQFSHFFVQETWRRDSQLIKPHFTYGFELTTSYPVHVTCMVNKWAQDANGTFTGCTVMWGAWAPDQPDHIIPFAGFLHLNFQGFGSPPDVDEAALADDFGVLD